MSKERMLSPKRTMSNVSERKIGNVIVTRSELRLGILSTDTWPKLFEENSALWKRLGGCEISSDDEPMCDPKATFNFFPSSRDAILDYPDQPASESQAKHVVGSFQTDVAPDTLEFPSLKPSALSARPTLLVFEVSGHVMLTIYFGNKRTGKPELHILNPWPMKGSQQFKDVYTLQEFTKSRITVVDIAQRLGEVYGMDVDLQENEKLGYCTLWVGILARNAIQRISELSSAVVNDRGTLAPGAAALAIYRDIYRDLAQNKKAIETTIRTQLRGLDCKDMAAAIAVLQLAVKSSKRGGRKTYRKRKRSRRTKRSVLR